MNCFELSQHFAAYPRQMEVELVVDGVRTPLAAEHIVPLDETVGIHAPSVQLEVSEPEIDARARIGGTKRKPKAK